MKWQMTSKQRIRSYFLYSLFTFLSFNLSFFSLKLEAQSFSSFQEEHGFSAKPLHKVATIGAPTTGSLIEGKMGSLHKGCRHRFYCYSSAPQLGFLGPQETAKPLSIKDQPGVFPAPLMGPASLTFSFSNQHPTTALTPIIVRPDGTVFKGLPIIAGNSPQTLVVSSPAQTGIYTLFVLAHQKEAQDAQITVDAKISTQPHQDKTFFLKSFEPTEQDLDLISAEFIYTPLY